MGAACLCPRRDARAFVQHTCVVGTWPHCRPVSSRAPTPPPALKPPGAQNPSRLSLPTVQCVHSLRWDPVQRAGLGVQARTTDPGSLMHWPGQLFMDSSCCFLEGLACNSPRSAVPCAACSTVADLLLYEPKCLSRNRSEDVACDKEIICQNCNNKEGLVGSLLV